MLDLGPAASTMARLVAAIADEHLDEPTPAGMSVGVLADHIGTFAVVFAGVARKVDRIAPPPPSADNLEPGWRDRMATDLDALTLAWRAPDAWEGMVTVGLELPADVAGQIALDELVVHGWDLATALGLPFEARPEDVAACTAWVEAFQPPRDGSLFGAIVPVPADAPALDRLLGLAGRNPAWAG